MDDASAASTSRRGRPRKNTAATAADFRKLLADQLLRSGVDADAVLAATDLRDFRGRRAGPPEIEIELPIQPVAVTRPVRCGREPGGDANAGGARVAGATIAQHPILLIPGTSLVTHLRENLATASLMLPKDAVVALDGIDGGDGEA